MPLFALIYTLCAAPAAGLAPTAPPPTSQDLAEQVRALEKRVHDLEADRAPPVAAPPTLPTAAEAPPAPAPAALKPRDEREPPFGDFDYTWMNGNNRQPGSLLGIGPADLSIYADIFYLFQFQQPIDHLAFPSTVAPRHNEFSVNLASVGVDVSRLGGPIGRVYVQFGLNTETNASADPTLARGFYLTQRAFQYIQQAAGGWHFHWLHGVNIEFGIMPSYIGMEGYLPQENWNYLHPFISDFTPYYFSGLRVQIYPTQHLKLEAWLVNGWQTFGQWHEAHSGGLLAQWRPNGRLVLTQATYLGQEAPQDPDSFRIYTDTHLQLNYYRGTRVRSLAVSLVVDYGYERRGNAPSGNIAGAALAHRVEWTAKWATTLRGDLYYDETQAVIIQLPAASGYSLPDKGGFLGGGLTATIDYVPQPWILFRIEYMHRESNMPYFSGSGGITGPNGLPPANDLERMQFQPDLRTSDNRMVANLTLRL